jgi:uncharacterized protein
MAATPLGNLTGEREAEEPVRSCPICGKRADFAIRPFCSKRCADVDLHRWLGGRYAVPIRDEAGTEEHGADRQQPKEFPEA